MGTITIAELAAELDTTPAEIASYLSYIGVPDLNGWQPSWYVHDQEAEDCRTHWTTDPTPQHQWQATDGAPDNPWSED